MAKNLLLLSNTTNAGEKPLEHAVEEIKNILQGRTTVTFIPYANPDGVGYQAYAERLQPVFVEMGYQLQLVDPTDPRRSVAGTEALFVGGGNTFELLRRLKEYGLMHPIREAVNRGVPYIGSSAGSVVAGLTIGTTNDMPAADSYGRDALALIPFNLNCHYQDTVQLTPTQKAAALDAVPQLRVILDHQGETRDERLREYHALGNLETIVALREGAMLRVIGDAVYLKGKTGARVFRPKEEPVELATESEAVRFV